MIKFLAIITLFSSLFISACGQRGPLYLPENAPPPAQSKDILIKK